MAKPMHGVQISLSIARRPVVNVVSVVATATTMLRGAWTMLPDALKPLNGVHTLGNTAQNLATNADHP